MEEEKLQVLSHILSSYLLFFCVSPLASQPMLRFCTVPDMSWRLLLIIYNPARLANYFFTCIITSQASLTD